MSGPAQEQAAAREEVMKCEQEIQSIKAALRRLGTSPSGEDSENSLEIVMIKVEGLPEAAKPEVSLQLSSPIEEGKLTTIFDPLNSDPAPEGSVVTFKGVETTVATLSVTAKDADIPLGSATPHDLAPVCALDPMNIKDKYVSEFPVAIVAEGQVPAEAEANVVADEATVQGTSEEGTQEGGAAAVMIQPVCTVTLRITYKPSPKDQQEELYELLNKTSQRKATALDNLRKISLAVARSGATAAPTQGTITKPSVKPGFLNKKKAKEPSKLQKLYERTLGPDSLLRRGAGVALFAKNYIIFFGAITFFHFKGQLLSLPPPV